MTNPILQDHWEKPIVKILEYVINEDGNLGARRVCKNWQKKIDEIIRLKWEQLKQNPPCFPIYLASVFTNIESTFPDQSENSTALNYLVFFKKLNNNFKTNGALIPKGELRISFNHFSQLQEQVLQNNRDLSLLQMWERLSSQLHYHVSHLHAAQDIRLWMKDPQTKNIRDAVICLNLSDLGIRFIPVEICHFLKIENLNLSRNHIDALPSFMSTLKLESLNLYDNDLTDLPEEFPNWVHIKYANLSENPLSEYGRLQLEKWDKNKRQMTMETEVDDTF